MGAISKTTKTASLLNTECKTIFKMNMYSANQLNVRTIEAT
jgi:hypothetical protein